MLANKTIGFIGAGDMGEALIRGLLKSKKIAHGQILASDKVKERLSYIAEKYEVKVFSENSELVKASDIIVFAVKSNDIKNAVKEIADDITKDKLVITIAAGVSINFLQEQIPHPVPPIIRAMPNAPVLVGEGAIGIYPAPGVSEDNKNIATYIFESVGKIVHIEKDELMDAVTGLSGSGPAYIFLIMEALSDAGVRQGLARKTANLLAIQTVLGAAKLALGSNRHFGELKDMVTSPGGTTIAGLLKLEEGAVRGTIMKAVEAATLWSKELTGV